MRYIVQCFVEFISAAVDFHFLTSDPLPMKIFFLIKIVVVVGPVEYVEKSHKPFKIRFLRFFYKLISVTIIFIKNVNKIIFSLSEVLLL